MVFPFSNGYSCALFPLADEQKVELHRDSASFALTLFVDSGLPAQPLPRVTLFSTHSSGMSRQGSKDLEWRSREVIAALRHADEVFDCCFSDDGRSLLTASKDGTVRLWDGSTGLPVSPKLPWMAEHINCLPTKAFLLSGTYGSVRIPALPDTSASLLERESLSMWELAAGRFALDPSGSQAPRNFTSREWLDRWTQLPRHVPIVRYGVS